MSQELIRRLVAVDLRNAEALSALLREERGLLEKRDVKALDELLSRKAGLLSDMEKNDRDRREHLEEAGFPATREGLKDFAAHFEQQASGLGREGGQTLSSDCQALFEALNDCRELTEINGRIVSRSRNNNARLLDILRGKTAEADTYSETGDKGGQSSSGSRPLGSA